MNKLIAGAIMLLALSAHQLSAEECGFDYCCSSPCKQFSGFYIGGNVGVLSHVTHAYRAVDFLSDAQDWSLVTTNVAGGVQLGWDYQCGSKVFGLVADWDAASNFDSLTDANDQYLSSKLCWYSTLRGRAGITVSDALVYLTAGMAVVDFETKWRFDSNLNQSRCRIGWAAGAGLEFLACGNFSVGGELLALFFSVDKKSGESTLNYYYGHADTCWTARLLVNYRL